MAVDLKQLAATLGLSQTTVSRALNGYSEVSAKTRERVERAAQELGYAPNPTARRLATGRADAVGIVYPVEADLMGNPRFLDMIAGVADRLESAGFDVLLAVARERSEQRTYERLVRGRRVDGLIVAHTRVHDERIEYLRRSGVPFVAYGRTGGNNDFAWFDFDNEAESRLAVAELARRGHRRIAYVHAPLALNFAQQRHHGFVQAMLEARLTIAAEYIVVGGLERVGAYAAARSLLEAPVRPTAIIVDNGVAGVGVVRALLQAGVRIGVDISVVVIEGIPADSLVADAEIASIEQPTAHESGATMGEMLLALIEGGPLAQPQVLRQARFVATASVGPAPHA
ncbi:MAG: substrate-binding domain-containing protein [Burkholderiales bacterium]|nr:substrate-binding domain-containing protein [Burkholderiales bacterium]